MVCLAREVRVGVTFGRYRASPPAIWVSPFGGDWELSHEGGWVAHMPQLVLHLLTRPFAFSSSLAGSPRYLLPLPALAPVDSQAPVGVVFFEEASRFVCGSVRQDLVTLDGNMETGHGGRGDPHLPETPSL